MQKEWSSEPLMDRHNMRILYRYKNKERLTFKNVIKSFVWVLIKDFLKEEYSFRDPSALTFEQSRLRIISCRNQPQYIPILQSNNRKLKHKQSKQLTDTTKELYQCKIPKTLDKYLSKWCKKCMQANTGNIYPILDRCLDKYQL